MDPKRDLLNLLDRGIDLDADRFGLGASRPKRRSAVLILFGTLDTVLADAPSTRSIPVISNGDAPPVAQEVLKKIPPTLDLLLQRRADGMRHHPGQIAFPGGGLNPGETSEEAAVREAQEETGLDPGAVEVLGRLPDIPLPVSDNLVTPVIGWWRRASEIAAVDHSEAVEVFRVPVAELLDPLARGTGVARRGNDEFRSDTFVLHPRFGGHSVWGFTGSLMSILFDALGWAPEWDRSRELSVKMTY